MKEIWIPVPIEPFNEYYKVSNKGNIWTCNPYRNRPPRLLKPGTITAGYLQVTLTHNKKSQAFRVHRLVALAFISNPKNKPQINHDNGDKSCNEVWNLEWSTSSENRIHALKTGLAKTIKGEDCSWSKLTKDQVKEIRKLYKTGKYSQAKLGKVFNIGQPTVWEIIHHKIWKDV